MPAEFYGKEGGLWRQVDPGLGLHFNDAGTWRDLSEAHYNDGGTWRQVYQKSNPTTYEFSPVSYSEYTSNGPINNWNNSSSLGTFTSEIGSYQIIIGPTVTSSPDYSTFMDFTTSTDSTSGLTLAQALAAQPTIMSAEIDLKRHTTGGSTINSGTYYFSWNNGGYESGTPTQESQYQSAISLASAGWTVNSTHTFTGLDFGLIDKLTTNTLHILNSIGWTNPGGSDSDYAVLSAPYGDHVLRVVLDF